MATRIFWGSIGCVALALGAIGVFLPLLPTTPLVLLAAFAFGRSNENWRRRLHEHRIFGPLIVRWQEEGAIAPRDKALSLTMMTGFLMISLFLDTGLVILTVQALVTAAAALFILTRPGGGLPRQGRGNPRKHVE